MELKWQGDNFLHSYIMFRVFFLEDQSIKEIKISLIQECVKEGLLQLSFFIGQNEPIERNKE